MTQGVVFSIIRLFPSAKQHAQVVEILRSVQDLTRPLPGCAGCWLSEQDVLYNHVRYAEQWESEEGMHEHIRSELYLRVLNAMELSKEPPEANFYYTKEQKGFELIGSIRNQATEPKNTQVLKPPKEWQ